MSCDAWHCGRRHYLHDDFGAIRLAPEVVAAPPLVLWPQTTARIPMPADVEQRHWLLLVEERKARVVARARGIRRSIIQVLPLQGYLDGKLPEGICLDLMDKIAGEMGTDLAVLHALKAAISALAKERKR